MKYMGDLDFWNQKFKSRDQNSMKPESALVDAVSLLQKGSVLDVACGDGRNSLYLSSEGFRVTGLDFSEEALKRLNHFASQSNEKIDTVRMDLSDPWWLEKIEAFDNIIVCHYRLLAEQLDQIHKHIHQHGILFITGFGHKHQVDQRIGEMDLIQPEDFSSMGDHFDRIAYSEFEDSRGALVTYIFKKR